VSRVFYRIIYCKISVQSCRISHHSLSGDKLDYLIYYIYLWKSCVEFLVGVNICQYYCWLLLDNTMNGAWKNIIYVYSSVGISCFPIWYCTICIHWQTRLLTCEYEIILGLCWQTTIHCRYLLISMHSIYPVEFKYIFRICQPPLITIFMGYHNRIQVWNQNYTSVRLQHKTNCKIIFEKMKWDSKNPILHW